MKDGTEMGSSRLDVEVQIERAVTINHNSVMLERTAENYGVPGARDRVLPKGPRDHLEDGGAGMKSVAKIPNMI